MTLERWQDLLATLKDTYPDVQTGKESLEEGPGQVEFAEFTGPLGKMRLEFITAPLITGKKSLGGRRVGTAAGVRYEYSATEETHTFHAYRWQDNDWQPMDASAFAS